MFAFKRNLLPTTILLCGAFLSVYSQQPAATAAPASASVSAEDVAKLRTSLSRAESRLKDWAQLGRYAEANKKVVPPEKGETRVVFMGDSITDIWSRDGYGGFFPGKPYINRGISGQTTPQMLIRFRPDVIDLKPRAVVILSGTNDLAGNTGPESIQTIEGNLQSMAELATAHEIHVVFASILPISDYNKNAKGEPIVRSTDRPPAQILELNNWMKDYATRNGYTYLDYFSAVKDDKGMFREDLANDGLHPNKKGYAIMSPLAEEAIQRALKSRH